MSAAIGPSSGFGFPLPFSQDSPMFDLAPVVHSLVNRRKSQTGTILRDAVGPTAPRASLLLDSYVSPRASFGRQSQACISTQEWSGKFRVRCSTSVNGHKLHNLNFGDRITKSMSSRGSSAILSSGEYVASKGLPYTTFLTLTLDKLARERLSTRLPAKKLRFFCSSGFSRDVLKRWVHKLDRNAEIREFYGVAPVFDGPYCPVKYTEIPKFYLENCGPFIVYDYHWESSVQKEVSRCMDSFKKMRMRGWYPEYVTGKVCLSNAGAKYTPISFIVPGSDNVKISGLSSEFCYCWVAEAPKNSSGLVNFHVHVLLNWRVLPSLFQAWAHRLERIWGQGFAKLELIRAPLAAGNYLLKASGYIAGNNEKGDQGEIRGNRYGVSKPARAPGWVFVSAFMWGSLGHLLNFARLEFAKTTQELRDERERIRAKLCISGAEKKDDFIRNRVLINAVNSKVASLKISFGKYSTIFKDRESIDKFFEWSILAGWSFGVKDTSNFLVEFRRNLKELRVNKLGIAFGKVCQEEWMGFVKHYNDYPDWYFDNEIVGEVF